MNAGNPVAMLGPIALGIVEGEWFGAPVPGRWPNRRLFSRRRAADGGDRPDDGRRPARWRRRRPGDRSEGGGGPARPDAARCADALLMRDVGAPMWVVVRQAGHGAPVDVAVFAEQAEAEAEARRLTAAAGQPGTHVVERRVAGAE